MDKYYPDNYGCTPPVPPAPPAPLFPSHRHHPHGYYYAPEININNNNNAICSGGCSTVPDTPLTPAAMMGYDITDFDDVDDDFKLIAEVPVTVDSNDIRLVTAHINWVTESLPCPCETAVTSDAPDGYAEFVITRALAAAAPLPENASPVPEEEILRAVAAAAAFEPTISNLEALDDLTAKTAAEAMIYKLYARVTDGIMRSMNPVTLMVRKYPVSPKTPNPELL